MMDSSGTTGERSSGDVYLIDGSGLAYRSYFAFQNRPLRTSTGVETSAVYGFVLTLISLLKRSPKRMAVVLDLPGPTHRHERFPEYKAHRPPTPESLVRQLDKIRDVVRALGIPLLEREGVEADDIIATLATESRNKGWRTVIVSADKDLFQLVGPGVSALVPASGPRREVHLDMEGVRQKMGVLPDQIVDYLGLMGDSSDNIPGVPGVGAKTAAKLIGEFGSMERIYRNLEKVKPDRVRRALEEHRDKALLSQELVQLRTDVPLGVSVDGLRSEAPDREMLESLFREMEFSKFLAQVVPAAQVKTGDTSSVRTAADVGTLAKALSGAERVAVELDSGDPKEAGSSRAMHFCRVSGGEAAYSVISMNLENRGEDDRKALESVLRERAGEIATLSAKNLTKNLAALGMNLGPVRFDAELAGYLLSPGRQSDLRALCAVYLGHLPEGIQAPEAQGTLGGVLDETGPAGAAVARAVCELVPVLEPLLEGQALMPLYRDIELPLTRVLADMESTGVKVEIDFLHRMSRDLGEQIKEIEEDVFDQVGERFNMSSPQQLKRILFDVLGLTPGKRTKTGFSTDSSVLEKLARENEIPRRVLRYRQLAKLKSTYLDALPMMVDPSTGRIHTTFHQTVTATGRLSSSDPNLQNIPMRTELGRELRKAFVPSGPDWRVYSADYSQIELRIVAHMAGDSGMIEAFRRGEDIHRATAAAVSKMDPADVAPAARDRAKAVNFGILYGMGPRALAASVGMDLAEARAFIKSYFETYPEVKTFIDRTVEEARGLGYVTTLLGRRRYLPELESGNPRDRAFGERTAVNTRIQGTAADIIKKAMVEIARRLAEDGYRSRMVLQVHDELVFEVPVDEVDRLRSMVTRTMISAVPLDVPVVVTDGVGMNWYEAH